MSDKLDLILHIGFPKCASTTLQNHVFKGENGYLGTHKGLKKSQNYAKQFQALSSVGPSLYGDFKQAKRWKRDVLNRYNPESLNRLILSSELLVNRNKIRERPIISFLKRFKREIWDVGDVKVLLILRNPAERMASGYAQGSIYNPSASQEHFQQKVIRQLQKKERLQYDKWVEELQEALGFENVCMLFMEEMQKPSFWERLSSFCQLDKFDCEEWLDNMKSKNTRKENENTWRIRDFDSSEKAKVLTNNVFGLLWPYYVKPEFRIKVHKKIKHIINQYYLQKYSNLTKTNRGVIRLTPEIRKEIQLNYKSQIIKLEKLLDKDLQKLGYR